MLATCLVIATAFPDVKHLKNLKIEENREYLPPLPDATNTIESSTGYDYPRPSIPFPNEIETIQSYKPQKKQQQPKLVGAPTHLSSVQTKTTLNIQKSSNPNLLPPALIITQRTPFARTGAETRIVSTTVKPFEKDYLPPVRDGAETRINVNVIPSPQPKFPTNEYLPPSTTTRTTTRRTTRRTTTTTPEPIPSSYAPAANTPIPTIVKPGPYFTKFDEENGYDYSKPAIGFDLPNNRVPVLNSADPDDEEIAFASASEPTNNVPVYTSSTTTTTEDYPPAPDVIYTPSHTLDDDGYRYKVPSKPFNF